MFTQPDITLAGKPPRLPARIARALASPVGVLIAMPLIVIAAGTAILLVGRDTTRSASESLVRRQLHDQAMQVEREIDVALDQAEPLLASLWAIANENEPIFTVGPHLYELAVGRPGVAWVSISYPDGRFQAATRKATGEYEIHESTIDGSTGAVQKYHPGFGGILTQFADEPSTYDPRTRDFYTAAVDQKKRLWTPPYTFFKTHETGVTCAEALYVHGKDLHAVLTVDFDIAALSDYINKTSIEGARTIVFAGDGSILAYPFAADQLQQVKFVEGKPVHADDIKDPSLTALMNAVAHRAKVTEFTYLDVKSGSGNYLASVMPIGGTRAGAANELAWYVATLVPEATLLGPTRRLATRSAIVSAVALAIAVALALMLAWNLVRMRRAVATSRARAAAAENRARELGSWRLVEKLGQGGMGEVWRAEHRLLVRQAAIKLMRADGKANARDAAETRERFRREAQALAAMRSRNTIEIFDYGVTEDLAFYYVMELLDGLDLDTLATRFGPQPAARVIAIMQQACASLAEAHDAGLLHRDVKPANIFLCRAADEVDVVKLLDFGIVHVVGAPVVAGPATGPGTPGPAPSTDRMTEVGTVLGTPGFMPPEQARGQALDARADLYALACVAWMLLTGTEVYERTTNQALMFEHVVSPVPSLARKVPGWIPQGLVDAITMCLAKEPSERPANARALGAMLRAIAIPPDQAWTVQKAQEWWTANVPVLALGGPSSQAGRLIMPVETDPTIASAAAAAPAGRPPVGAAATIRDVRPPPPEGKTAVERPR